MKSSFRNLKLIGIEITSVSLESNFLWTNKLREYYKVCLYKKKKDNFLISIKNKKKDIHLKLFMKFFYYLVGFISNQNKSKKLYLLSGNIFLYFFFDFFYPRVSIYNGYTFFDIFIDAKKLGFHVGEFFSNKKSAKYEKI